MATPRCACWLCASEVGRDGWNGTTLCRRRFSPVDLSQMVNGVSRSPLKRQVKRDFLFGSVPGAIARKAKDLKPAEVGNFLCSYAALPLPRVSNAERDHKSFFAFKEGTTPTESDAAAPPSLATAEREAGISLEEAADAGLEGDFGAMRVAVGMLALRLGQQAASSFGTPLPDFATEYGDRNPSIAHSLARKAEQRADVAPVTSQAVCNTVYGLARLRAATDEALEEAAVTRARQRAELAMASADFTTSEPDDGSDATTAPGGTCVCLPVSLCVVGCPCVQMRVDMVSHNECVYVRMCDCWTDKSVYEILQDLSDDVLRAIGTGRGKQDASPLGVMQALWVRPRHTRCYAGSGARN